MVPGLRRGKFPFLALFKHISIVPVLKGDTVQLAGFFLLACNYPLPGEWLSGQETHFSSVRGLEHDGELFIGYPPFCPVDFWLGSREPGVPKDDLVIAQV